MVLELKEYTMASLGYKSSENLLISVNQTHLTSHNIKRPPIPPFPSISLRSLISFCSSFPPPLRFRRPKEAASMLTLSIYLLPSSSLKHVPASSSSRSLSFAQLPTMTAKPFFRRTVAEVNGKV